MNVTPIGQNPKVMLNQLYNHPNWVSEKEDLIQEVLPFIIKKDPNSDNFLVIWSNPEKKEMSVPFRITSQNQWLFRNGADNIHTELNKLIADIFTHYK